MTAKRAAWVVFAVAALLILGFYFAQNAARSADAGASSETSGTADQDGQGQSESPAEVDRGNGFSQSFPDGPQAPDRATPMQYERQEITIPSVPAPDTQDPAAVAQAFLTVYNSRESETDKTWENTTKPWLTPNLAQQLTNVTNGALTGKTPAAVSAVKVGEHVQDWGADTPLRWSHHAQVTVDTQDQGSYQLDYRLQAQLTDQGWLINSAQLDSWQRVEK